MGGTEQSKHIAHGETKEFAVANLMTKTGGRNYRLIPESPNVLFNDIGGGAPSAEWATNVIHTDEYSMQHKMYVKRHRDGNFVAFYRTLNDV